MNYLKKKSIRKLKKKRTSLKKEQNKLQGTRKL